jgi:hypothetical protein
VAEENQNQSAPLQVQDLVVALEAIQLASSRGAYKVEEFSAVGNAYTNLYNFLVASGVVTPQPAENSAPDQTQ